MKHRRLWFVLALSLLAGSLSLWVWLHQQRDSASRNFRVVEPGRIYAGGYQFAEPLTNLVKEHSIKSVLCLRGDEDEEDGTERTVLQDAGVPFHRIAIRFSKKSPEENLALVAEAADFIADPANQPIYVHCWGGKHRVGAVVAVYRLRHCAWTFDAAKSELAKYDGLSVNGPLRLVEAYRSHSSNTEKHVPADPSPEPKNVE